MMNCAMQSTIACRPKYASCSDTYKTCIYPKGPVHRRSKSISQIGQKGRTGFVCCQETKPVQTFSRMGLTKRKVSGESCEKVQFSDCRPLSLPCGCRLFIRSSSPLSQPLAVSEHQWCAAEFWESLTVGMNANSGPDPEMYPSRGLLSRSAHDGH